MCLDGPTFVATEGWDWIPAIRDRDSGIWQPVTLKATSFVKIGDPQVTSALPFPDTSYAAIEISVPLENTSSTTVTGTLSASFGDVVVTKEVRAVTGESEIKLTPVEYPQLTVQHPRLWWPNGYGRPDLYTLQLTFAEGTSVSATKQLRFGIREVTYELSLFDEAGHLRRLEYSPTTARVKGEQIVDVRREAIRNVPPADPFPAILPQEWKEGWKSWVYSLAPGAASSSAVHMLDDTTMSPYLAIKVNGVRIAARGG